jgi:hypothetical protein
MANDDMLCQIGRRQMETDIVRNYRPEDATLQTRAQQVDDTS